MSLLIYIIDFDTMELDNAELDTVELDNVELDNVNYPIYRRGDFIDCNISKTPAVVIVQCSDNNILISIDEYNGDYTFIDPITVDIKLSNIDNYKRLSILAGFGKWFYTEHKELYQELLIDTLINYRVITPLNI